MSSPPRPLVVLLTSLLVLVLLAGPAHAAEDAPLLDLDIYMQRQASLPAPTAGMMAHFRESDGQIYLFGGYQNNNAGGKLLSQQILRYDAGLDSVVEVGQMPIGLALSASVYAADRDRVYFFGGLLQTDPANAPTPTDKNWSYDFATDTWSELPKTLPSTRLRGAAAYNPDEGIFYIVGGQDREDFDDADYRNQILSFNPDDGALTVKELPNLNNRNAWTTVLFFPFPFSETMTTNEQPSFQLPVGLQTNTNRSHIWLTGTHGYAALDASDFSTLAAETEPGSGGRIGAGQSWISSEQSIWSVGGYGNPRPDCYVDHVDVFEPFSRSRAKYTDLPDLTYATQDTAAVYAPNLNRLFVFGGFTAPPPLNNDDTCRTTFQPDPTSAQYSDGIYTLSSRTPQGGYVASITNTAAGSFTNVTVENTTGAYDVAIQAAFEDIDGNPYFQTRILTPQVIQRSDADDVVGILLPDNLYPGEFQRVAALCVLPENSAVPNCREVKLTLVPGSLSGTIVRDMTPIGGQGTQPVANVSLELIDEDGASIKTVTTDANGNYNFCDPGSRCLGIGEFNLHVTRPWRPEDDFEGKPFFHKTPSPAVTIEADVDHVQNFTLETSRKLIGTVISFRAKYDGHPSGEHVGTFLLFDAYPNLRVDPVKNKFTIEASEHFAVATRVRFRLNGSEKEGVKNGGKWSTTFDMNNLNEGENTLEIVTFHTREGEDFESEPQNFTIHASPFPKNLNQENIALPFGVEWVEAKKNVDEHYRVHVVKPPFLVWPDDKKSEKVDLDRFTLHNRVQMGANIKEDYFLDGKRTAKGDIKLTLNLLGFDADFALIDRTLGEISATYGPDKRYVESYEILSRPIDICALMRQWKIAKNTYKAATGKDKTDSGTSYCDSWLPTPLGRPYEGKILGVDVKLHLGVLFKIGGDLWFYGSLNGDNWRWRKNFGIIPVPRLTVLAGAATEADFVVATGEVGAGVEGVLKGAMPIEYDPNTTPNLHHDQLCFGLTLGLKVWASYETLTKTGREEFRIGDWVDARSPKNCFIPEVKASGAVSETLTPEVMPAPALDIAEDGGLMQVWIEDKDPVIDSADLVLRYAYAGAQSDSGILFDGGDLSDPAVTFLGNDRAMAFWTDLAPETRRAEILDLADMVPHQEIYASLWTRGSGWAPPERLTSNQVGDGLPLVAAHPNGTELLLIWNRDGDGNANTRGDWQIMSRTWSQANGWGAEQVAASEAGAADFSPTLAWHPNSGSAWLVWTRQREVDTTGFQRNDLRRLAYSVWTNGAWEAAVEPTEWPAGATHPSIAFRPSGSARPLVAMVVPPPPNNPEEISPAFGPDSRLHTAWFRVGAWEVQSVADSRGSRPQVTFYTNRHPLIILRGYGGGENDGPISGGQVAVAAGKLSGNNELRWAPPGVITQNPNVIWQIGGVALPANGTVGNGMVSFIAVTDSFPDEEAVRTRGVERWQRGTRAAVEMAGELEATALGGDGQTGIFGISDDMDGYDPEVESVELSNDLPRAGELVSVTVTLRNTELRPLGSTGDGPFEINLCADGRPCPFSGDDGFDAGYRGNLRRYPLDNTSLPLDIFGETEMLFNETISVTLVYISKGSPEKLEVRIQRNANDLDGSNNMLEFSVGDQEERPPVETTVALSASTERAGEKQVEISWREFVTPTLFTLTGQPLAPYFQIYRSSSPDGPWKLIGVSTDGSSYVDTPPDDAVYYYSVSQADLFGRTSVRSRPAVTEGGDAPTLVIEEPPVQEYSLFAPVIRR